MKNNGGPAFPCYDGSGLSCTGMSMRQYYAGQAMMGLLANPNNSKEFSHEIAEWAVMQADALLAELAKEE